MADINFGILDTQSPAKIGNAFIRSPEQQNANMLQVMQMQQLMDQREQAQYALGKSRREETGLAAFGEGLRALGPDPDPDAVAQLFIKHPDIGMQKTGIELMQRSQANKKYLSLKQPGGAGASPVAVAPSAAAPGSFGENMLANRAALSFGDNPPAVTAPAAARTRESRIAQLRTEAAKLAPLALPGTFAKAERDDILEEIKGLLKPQVMAAGSVFDAPGVDRVTAPQLPQQPRQVNLATDLLIPGPNGTMVPNTALVNVRTNLARESRPLRPEAAPRTQQVTMRDGTLGIMNMDTGAITASTLGGAPVKGKPSAFAEKTAVQRAQMGKDLGFAITQLTDITKDGGLIDQSTGSGAGRLTDIGAGFFGSATPGAIAIGKIAPIADLALKMVPRFEGPQSNADTKSYKEAAGQLADSSLPTKIRKEAGKVVLRIMQARKDQFVTNDMAAEGATSGSTTPASAANAPGQWGKAVAE